MRYKSILIIALVLLVLIMGCAGPSQASQQAKLRSELLKWESFDSEGIVEMSYMGLSLRKMFSLAKHKNELRFDIFDGGIIGFGTEPLISLYLGDYNSFKSSLPMLDALNPFSGMPIEGMNLMADADSLVALHSPEIIANKALVLNNLRLSFSPAYQIMAITDPKTNTELKATYSNSGKLQEINLKGMDNISAKLIFDKIAYTAPQITPLPPISNKQPLFPDLNDVNLKELLKEMLK